jgi:2-succinyl-5-enolpyruvyl-6-hydroxy-3-cyclohexene-1-carboxylate synthase
VSNLRLAQTILEQAYAQGVSEVILCAGARNAPFVKLLSQASPFKIYSFFEERSAAFFALGRAQSEGRPVAVITTSGTAAAELLPACIEADYQRKPLLLITADRPRRYRGSGAPQTIIQTGIFSHYTGGEWDIEGEWTGDLSVLQEGRPVHVNVCFDEPLLEGDFLAWNLKSAPAPRANSSFSAARKDKAFIEMKKPLVIVGGLTSSEAGRVLPILSGWKRPLYLEGPSRLRGLEALKDFELLGAEKTFTHLKFDGVIRIGSVPTLRYWRDLEAGQLPVHCFSDLPFSGLPRLKDVSPLVDLPVDLKFEFWSESERQKDRDLARRREILLKEYPLSEPAWVEWLSGQIPASARLFIGNSLPIREWDFVARSSATRDVFANRGTNGIDGLISTFAGTASESGANWALLGDLSLMYDLSGPWALKQRPLKEFNLVVINNGGGQIFRRLFENSDFLNAHNLRFSHWAKMWGLEYLELKDSRVNLAGGQRVIEILPDAEQTADFWRAWESST